MEKEQGLYPSMPNAPDHGHPNAQTEFVVTGQQPPPVMSVPTVFGPNSLTLTCPYCHKGVTSVVRAESSSKTHLIAVLLCFVSCCCIPYCMDSYDNLLSQAEVARLSLQLANIEPLYDLFSQVQDDIETTSDNLEIEYAETSAFEDKYFKLISVAKVYLANYDSTAVKSRSPNVLGSAPIDMMMVPSAIYAGSERVERRVLWCSGSSCVIEELTYDFAAPVSTSVHTVW
ncbi:hypothetical protein RN001_010264 [Aquatica leii]|uniref:LITAF domain-containing protein n=1 Tax=Aquatica leii TaxID=1421715 RepID=A0AAN7QHC7_9COLE|nr:hypothetical protein RN001_010264 [Aquatica leii]